MKCFSWKRGDKPKSILRKSQSPPKAAKILSAICRKEADFLSQPPLLCLPLHRWAQWLRTNGSSLLVPVPAWEQGLKARFGTSPSSFCCALERSVCLKLTRWSTGVSQMEFLSPGAAHRFVLAPRHAERELLGLQISVCVRQQLYVTTEFTANAKLGGVSTRWQTGSSQQTRLLFRETSALRACQWVLKTPPGKPSPVLGSPAMQLMQWSDTREDHQDDQVAEAPDVWGQSWVLRALRGESYNYLTESRRRARLSTEEHSNRTGCDEDKLEWERCLKPSSKLLLSPSLDKTPSEVPQQPVLCCRTKPNGNQMAAT